MRELVPPLPEPRAWLHIQGRHSEVSERRLADDEIERGWTQEPLFTLAQLEEATSQERRRCVQAIERLRLASTYQGQGPITLEDCIEAIKEGK